MKERSFTLLEILIVIIIVGILAGLGMASYTGVKEKTLGKEAIANLKLIASAERIRRMETGGYYISSNLQNINDNLKLSLSDSNWAYSVSGTAATFSATATRGACIYTLTDSDADGEPNPDAGCQ